jgi:uncharacterized membrane protein
MADVLPPLEAKYGQQFQLLKLEMSSVRSYDLFLVAVEHFQIPNERRGVPLLVIGETVLVGQDEVAQQLSAEIERGLAAGGVDFTPALGITPEDLAGLPATETAAQSSPTRGPDPVANALALVVLAGMLLSLSYLAVSVVRSYSSSVSRATQALANPPVWQQWFILVLIIVGLAVSGYLSYVKLSETAVICGPLGDCDAVQHSTYSQLFGVPVAILGFLTYLAVLVLWAWGKFGRGRLAELVPLGLFGLAAFGTAFSAYLTFLEPFVIRAVCIWCVTSATTMTLILWLASRPVLKRQRIDVQDV